MKNTKTSNSESKKRSDASKKGWVTRRSNQAKTRTSRKVTSDKLKKLQKQEQIRNTSRRKAQKVGRSIISDKPKLRKSKPTRPTRRPSKRRVSLR
ncbi:MAG: hypothetical protein R3237_02890 [Nitrosopumilaceae archaeon]|nr:hypothetical protein [Nitrosopumilaceae archaeon]